MAIDRTTMTGRMGADVAERLRRLEESRRDGGFDRDDLRRLMDGIARFDGRLEAIMSLVTELLRFQRLSGIASDSAPASSRPYATDQLARQLTRFVRAGIRSL